jgi:signal transduction histidine kinase
MPDSLPSEDGPLTSKANILLVDDQPDNLLALETILRDLGQNLVRAQSGQEALRRLLGEDCAVILLDVRMPDMDGYETARLIRGRDRSAHTPIIFLTAVEGPDFPAREAYSLGAVDFLVKPLVPEILRSKVAVFVELYHKTEEVKRQGELLREMEHREFERRLAEEKLRQTEERYREIHRLNTELERRVLERTSALEREAAQHKRTAAELTRSNRELEQFAYVASHDLKEPLRKVRIYLQLLEQQYRGRLDEKADQYIAYAVDSAGQMQALVNDLLAYARVGSRGKPSGPVDCSAAFDQAVANLGMPVQESGAVVTRGDLPTVQADASQLVQLFQNLVENAVKFRGDQPPVVRAEAVRQEGEWLFSVKDNGIGIDRQYAERVFVIFERLHSKVEYPGTGMGLAICKKIVERHGGKIWVESQSGKGATFWFSLPAEEGQQR